MEQRSLTGILADQTERALWEVKNVIDCVPDAYWNREYSQMPLWKHIYHMLHSLDVWFINPRDPHFVEPPFHVSGLNDLDADSQERLTRAELDDYFARVKQKIEKYLHSLCDQELLTAPDGCEYAKFTLIMAQHRHLHTHMGMIMGFLIDDTGRWPQVIGLEGEFPQDGFPRYF